MPEFHFSHCFQKLDMDMSQNDVAFFFKDNPTLMAG
jgi:hypothetical protein